MEQTEVAVVGAGQAGLALSHELTSAGIGHVVLERGGIGETWRRRWTSFCLVTPNWSVRLPGYPYDGDDPDGFMARDEIVGYLQRYAGSFDAPVREGVAVERVGRSPDGSFRLDTSSGPLRASLLVLTTGAYQRPHRVPGSEALPAGLPSLQVEDYRDPESLPSGAVLIVGSGQTGAQIAEELREAGREVYLACSRAPWIPRRLAGKDVVWWLAESGVMDQPLAALPTPAARLLSNPLATGHGGGHDLHLRTLQAQGVTLTGRFLGVSGRDVLFAPDLSESVAWGDARHRELVDAFQKAARANGMEELHEREPEPFFQADTPERLDTASLGAVLFTAGYRPDYSSWLPWPEAFDDLGFPLHQDGESALVPGLFFLGVHFLRTRKSALLMGVGEDATVVAGRIAGRLRQGMAA